MAICRLVSSALSSGRELALKEEVKSRVLFSVLWHISSVTLAKYLTILSFRVLTYNN